MPGGSRVLTVFFIFSIALCALLTAQDAPPPSAPPKAKVDPVEETVQGHKIVDPYRYLENADDPAATLWVDHELAYTRSLLDPLPGREKINARLAQLFAIGSIGIPQAGGKYYFHTRRDAGQNQPVLYVREGINGEDRVLLDINKLSADGTVALDWWYVTEDGKYLAYGTSPNGSEESTLRIIEPASGKTLPDAIEHTNAASLAWLTRRFRLLLHPLSKERRRPRRPGGLPSPCLLPRPRHRSRQGPAHFRRGPQSRRVARYLALRR